MRTVLFLFIISAIVLFVTANITPHTVKSVDNVMIYYDEIGSPNNPTILFLHGVATGRMAFMPQFNDRRLLDKFHLVRMDYRGSGRSSKPTNISMYDNIYIYADDLNVVIQDVTKSYPKKKVVLVGRTFGFPIIGEVWLRQGGRSCQL